MTILLETSVPEHGRLSIHIHAEVEINISAEKAQHHVTQYVHRKISTQMHAQTPTLTLSERAYWRVPIHLTFPSSGDVGSVGAIDVDVETGELKTDEPIIREIERHAEEIAQRIAHPAAS